ncbi:MAG: hypothetical protein AAB797_02710 [Patescibacteria group bacterium]
MQLNKKWLAKNLNFILLGVLTVSVVANQAVLANTNKVMGIEAGALPSLSVNFLKILRGGAKLSGNLGEDAVKLVFMQGAPEVYGAELNVNYDDVQNSMNVMKQFDLGYGNNKPALSAEEKKRYTAINLRISCEFCCGAAAIVFENGEASCGCAHSQAMRGLTAYLIKNHGAEYSDDEILRELAKWKGRYFPKQMVQKMTEQIQSSQFTPDIASLLLDVKLPKYGANSQPAPIPSDIKNLPSMVGGC